MGLRGNTKNLSCAPSISTDQRRNRLVIQGTVELEKNSQSRAQFLASLLDDTSRRFALDAMVPQVVTKPEALNDEGSDTGGAS